MRIPIPIVEMIAVRRVAVMVYGFVRITFFWRVMRVGVGARIIQMTRLMIRKTAMMRIQWMKILR